MIEEHDRVVLTTDLPDSKLKAGDVGIVVHIYKSGEHLEVEVFTADHKTLDVVTVHRSQVRPVGATEVLRVRPLE